ncbi:Disabled-like protein 2, partial [Nibea albiflora]
CFPGVPRTPSDSASRFLGDGVRYKAKLIGVDPVPDAQGEKMCWDSMMKLKGFEEAARRQGKHKQRVWLKVSSSGLKIMDERTGILLYDHDRTRISSLRKDESDPRALAYVYQHQDTYILYYIRMANLADPVLVDIKEVCQGVDQETPQEAAEAPAQSPALEDVFSPDSSSPQSKQASSTNELMEVFSIQMADPMMPAQTSCTSQPGSPGSTGRKMPLPAVVSPPKPPQRTSKPSRLPRQVASMDIEDIQDTYDDIASFEKNESWSDNSSQCMDEDNEDVYESIDEEEIEMNRANAEKRNKKEAKRKKEQEKKEQMARQKKENELKKNFQLQGEVEVLHTAKVRHDWSGGGKLDLSVYQGESVEILRVKNNPGGKWLARSLNGNYGYISNTCVDIDYEAVKRKVLQSRKIDASPLPPPPPDPPQISSMESNSRE